MSWPPERRGGAPSIVTDFNDSVPPDWTQGGVDERGFPGGEDAHLASMTSSQCHRIVCNIADLGRNIQTTSTWATTETRSMQRQSFPGVAFLSEKASMGWARVMEHVHSLSQRLLQGTDIGNLPDTDEEKLQWIGLTETAIIVAGTCLASHVVGNSVFVAHTAMEHGRLSEFWSDTCWRAYLFRALIPSCLIVAAAFFSFFLLSASKRLGISYRAAFTGLITINLGIQKVHSVMCASLHENWLDVIWGAESLLSILPFFLLPRQPLTLVISMFLLILFMIGTVFEIAYLPLHKREFPLMYSAHNTSERDSHTGGNAFAEFPCSCSDNYDLANIVLSAMILGLLFPLGVLATLRRFQKQHFELELRTEAHRRESEQMSLRNDELLRGLFPPAMAAQVLSLNGSTHNWCKSDMNLHQDVSVLQVDIKGFTALSTRIDAGELLDIVNAIFSSIDAAAEIIGGLFKIDTIGDCYKAVSGLLVPCKDHADKVADLALAIIDIVDIISRRLNIPDLSVRLGIGTGPVVAAAVGQLRPKFCIYGKACQEANLMETSAQEGRVHVSRETVRRLGEHRKIEVASDDDENGAYVCPVGDASMAGAPSWRPRLEGLITSLKGFDMPPTPSPATEMPGMIQMWAEKAASQAHTPKQGMPSDQNAPENDSLNGGFKICEWSDSGSTSIIMLSGSGVLALATTFIPPMWRMTAFTFDGEAPGVVYAFLDAVLVVLHLLPTFVGSWHRILRHMTTCLLFLSPFAFNSLVHSELSHISFSACWSFMGVLNHQACVQSSATYVLYASITALVYTCQYYHSLARASRGLDDENMRMDESNGSVDADDPEDDGHENSIIGIHLKIVLAINVIGIAVVFFSTVAYRLSHVIKQEAHQRSALAIQKGHEETQDEILMALVPERVCHQLKRGDRFISSRHEYATVMFFYLDHFEEILSKHGPEETIVWVRRVFCEFDGVLSSQNPNSTRVTKIESFQSFYMAICGLEGEADSVDVAVIMAVNLADVGVAVKRPDGTLTTLKIGMECGPLSAGVIGVQFPRFSVFGETVNMASRWASNAGVSTFFRTVVGMSENAVHHISRDLEEKLAACNLRVWEIGLKDIKGKGCECMWEISSRTERDPLFRRRRSFRSSFLKLPCIQPTFSLGGRCKSESLNLSPTNADGAVTEPGVKPCLIPVTRRLDTAASSRSIKEWEPSSLLQVTDHQST